MPEDGSTDIEEVMDFILTLIDEDLSDEEIVAKVREKFPSTATSNMPVSLIDLFRTKPREEAPPASE